MKFLVSIVFGILVLSQAGIVSAEDIEQNLQDDSAITSVDSESGETKSHKKGFQAAPFPVIMYTPETRFGTGAGVVFTHRHDDGNDSDKPNNMPVTFIITQNSQFIISAAPEVYLDGQKSKIGLAGSFARWPRTFYGVGNDTPESSEEDYTPEETAFVLTAQRKLVSKLSAGIIAEYQTTRIKTVEFGKLLDRELLTGYDGGTRTGAGIVLEWDTRDSIFYPSTGGYYKMYYALYRTGLGGDFSFNDLTFDFRRFLPLGGSHVLSIQTYGQFLDGDIPFNRLATLGGNIMRGIVEGRYQDRDILTAQFEYRFPISKRWRGAAFASAGDVAHRPDDFNMSDIKYSAGGGLRFALNPDEGINLRIDYGTSPWGSSMYIQILEAL